MFERYKFRVTVTTAPAAEPVSLAEAKLFARQSDSVAAEEDALFTSLIIGARQIVEEMTGLSFVTRTLDVWADEIPVCRTIELPYSPVASIAHVKGFDEDGTETALTVGDDTILDVSAGIFNVLSTADMPTSDRTFNAFNVQYIAGYGVAGSVPDWAKIVIKQLVAHWYENREAIDTGIMSKIPFEVDMIIQQNKRTMM